MAKVDKIEEAVRSAVMAYAPPPEYTVVFRCIGVSSTSLLRDPAKIEANSPETKMDRGFLVHSGTGVGKVLIKDGTGKYDLVSFVVQTTTPGFKSFASAEFKSFAVRLSEFAKPEFIEAANSNALGMQTFVSARLGERTRLFQFVTVAADRATLVEASTSFIDDILSSITKYDCYNR